MRPFRILPVAILLAACGDQSSPTAPAPSTPAAAARAASPMLAIAVDDALGRLVTGLRPDAAEPVAADLRVLRAVLHASTSPAAIADARDRLDATLGRFTAADRADAATLDALRLELDVAR